MRRHENGYCPRFGQDNANEIFQKLQKLKNFAYIENNSFHLGFEVGQGSRSSIKCFLGPQICLGRGAKTLQVSKLTLGQGLATFSYTTLFQNYPKSYENEGFRWNLKLSLKAT